MTDDNKYYLIATCYKASGKSYNHEVNHFTQYDGLSFEDFCIATYHDEEKILSKLDEYCGVKNGTIAANGFYVTLVFVDQTNEICSSRLIVSGN